MKFRRSLWLFAAFLMVLPVGADNSALVNSPDWPPYQWFASTDKKHNNDDYILLASGETRKIPLAAGDLERLWFTAIEPDKIEVKLLNPAPVALYNDGKIVFSPASTAGNRTIHEKAFVWHPSLTPVGEWKITTPTTGFSLKPNAFLQVTNHSKEGDGNKFFYQISVRPSHKTVVLPEQTRAHLAQNIELNAGESKDFNFTGAGLIQTISLSLSAQDVQSVQLRAAWDGQTNDAINAPLSALLGLFQHGETVQSAAFDFDGKKANFKWPLPFGDGAKITLINSGTSPLKMGVEINSAQLIQAPPYRFYAAYGSARTQEKKPVPVLNVQGRGAFCGLNLSITPAPDSGRRTFAYLEGNETLVADGKKYEGTGTEDFFSSAWYFPKKSFSFPFHGMTYKTTSPPGVAAYRLMIPDALPFQKSLRFDFEHGNNYNSNDLLFRWVGFWYAEPKAPFQIADALQDNVPRLAQGAPSQFHIFLVALVTALIVGGGGGFLVKMARKRAEKSS